MAIFPQVPEQSAQHLRQTVAAQHHDGDCGCDTRMPGLGVLDYARRDRGCDHSADEQAEHHIDVGEPDMR